MSGFDLTPYLRDGGSRPDAIPGLEGAFRDNIGAMFAAAPDDIRRGLTIKSAYRSPQRQAEIMRDSLASRVGPDAAARWQGYVDQAGGDVVAAGEAARPWLRETGITKWVAPPGASNHQHGVAADLGYASPEVAAWAQANAGRFGLAFPLGNENWHVEPAGARSGAAPAAPQAAPVVTASQVAAGPQAASLPSAPAPTLADLMAASAEADGASRQVQQALLGDLLAQNDRAAKQKKAQAAEEERARRVALFGDVLGAQI